MQPSTPTPSPRSDGGTALCGNDLDEVVRREIRTPLAALRATLEALVGELRAQPPAPGTATSARLEGALAQVVRLGHHVGELIELTVPPPLRGGTCSLGELARSAAGAPAPACPVTVALERCGERLAVDPERVTRVLRGLIAERREAGARELLLHAAPEGSGARLTLLEDVPAKDVPGAATTLARFLAVREVERLGGSIEFGPPGARVACTVHLPGRETCS